MTDNEIKMQHRIMELEAFNAANINEIDRLESINLFLRSIIEKLIDNGKN